MAMIEGRPPEDQFLESRVSANYGAWTCRYDLIGDFYEVGKHEPGDKMIRRDWDRRQSPSDVIIAQYRSDLEANEAILDRLTESVVFILKKLADGEDAIAVQQD